MEKAANAGNLLVRKLSFGRKKPANPPVAAVPPPASALRPASAPLKKAEPKAEVPPAPAPTPTPLKKESTRRTLSFNRRGRGQGAKPAPKEPGQKHSPGNLTVSPAVRKLPGSFARALNLEGANAAPAVSLNNLKRTNSWSRGHSQAKKAEIAAKAAAVKVLLAAAPSLLGELTPPSRNQLSQVCKRMLEIARELEELGDSSDTPNAALDHTCFTHEGGAGGKQKENQDTFFVAHPSKDVAIYAVFDGHGRKYGKLAASAAASAAKSFLCAHHRWLLACPQEAMRHAFAIAHAAVRSAMLQQDPTMRLVESAADPFLLQWMECDEDEGRPEDEGHKWDAADGGTTATIAAVLQGRRLVTSVVGDSAALLMGREGHERGKEGSSSARHEVLVEEHSPTNLPEYVRMRSLSSGARLKFVYDCPDFEEFDIFSRDARGRAQLDADALRQADEHNVMLKNPRDDRFTLVIIPSETIKVAALPGGPGGGEEHSTMVEEQAITMTRSLGDFYAHHHGVTWEPETSVMFLSQIAERKWRQPSLMLASDGVWDLWNYNEVVDELVSPDNADPARMAKRAADFCEDTRSKGCQYFDEAADNLTGVLVNLDGVVYATSSSQA